MKNILVIGSSNIDMIIKMDRLPKVGETITDGEFVQVFGGKGANQAVAAARLGGNVTFINCVGDDAYADIMINNFKKDKIETKYIFKEKNIASGTALIMIGDVGNNYLAVAPGANYKLNNDYIDQSLDAIKNADLIVIQLEIPIETTKYIIEISKKYNKKVIFNCAPISAFDKSYLSEIYILIVNETETEELTKLNVSTKSEIEIAGKKLLSFGAKNIIITLGSHGAYYADAYGGTFVPSFKVEAVDTTAAGDTFCGGLAVALCEEKNLKDAIRFASAASAISVTKLGAQPSIPNRTEVDVFLHNLPL